MSSMEIQGWELSDGNKQFQDDLMEQYVLRSLFHIQTLPYVQVLLSNIRTRSLKEQQNSPLTSWLQGIGAAYHR